jgi:5-methyltetrahydropteroyltriglutamate--homocysteine methyltransferase
MAHHHGGLLGNRQPGIGAGNVQTPDIETGEQVADRIRVHTWLAPGQTLITSSCGFNHQPRHIVMGKLLAMAEAKAILQSDVRQ